MKNYDKYMKKCLKLAQKGEGKVSPNPLVGCVVLDKDGREISTGYHKKYGELHAEAQALKEITTEAKEGTLIVNLEPCSHWGKTPPCADLIIKKGIKHIIVGMQDPNPLVAGKGLEKCKKAGIEVITNVLNEKAQELNEIFIKNMTKRQCFIAIKTATTLDGKIATKNGNSKWITSEKARKEVQRLRNKYDGILTTSKTVIKDNPSLTCRIKNGRNPVRIILDRELKTDLQSKVYADDGTKVYIIVDEATSNAKIKTIPSHIEVIKCKVNNYKLDLAFAFEKLYEKGIYSILVEAGGKLNGELIKTCLVDKIYHFIAPKILADNEGISAFEGCEQKEISNAFNFKFRAIADYYPDILVIYSI